MDGFSIETYAGVEPSVPGRAGLMDRRSFLRMVGVGATVLLAGCADLYEAYERWDAFKSDVEDLGYVSDSD